jgi:translation initiation factor IF-1
VELNSCPRHTNSCGDGRFVLDSTGFFKVYAHVSSSSKKHLIEMRTSPDHVVVRVSDAGNAHSHADMVLLYQATWYYYIMHDYASSHISPIMGN